MALAPSGEQQAADYGQYGSDTSTHAPSVGLSGCGLSALGVPPGFRMARRLQNTGGWHRIAAISIAYGTCNPLILMNY